MNDLVLGKNDLGAILDGFINIVAERVAERLKGQQSPEKPQKEVLNMDEVAEYTGYSKASIYKFVGAKTIPFHHSEARGKRLIFFRTEIEVWLKGERFESLAEFTARKHNEIKTLRRQAS